MKKPVNILLILFISCISNANLQGQVDSTTNKNYTEVRQYFNNFKDMHISHYGTTQNCEAYDVYAFKFRRFWFLFVKQGEQLSIMHIKPPIKETQIYYPSKEFAKGIAQCYALNYTKLVKRKRRVVDMDIYGFYKFNRFGRKVMKGLLLLEYPFYNKGFFKWKLDKKELKKKMENKSATSAEKAKQKAKPEKIETIKNKVKKQVPVKEKK